MDDPKKPEIYYEVPPESEFYGRSLRAVRKLGAYMLTLTEEERADVIRTYRVEQARVEFNTSVDEGLGTDQEQGNSLEVRDFDYRPVINGQVMAKDLETPIVSLTEAGLRSAAIREKHDEWFKPQAVRTSHDHQNAVAVDEMAQGSRPYNTRILISPFPEEAAKVSGDEYWRQIGYVPHLKRGFVQLYFAKDGEVLCGSLSFDGSNKERIREELGKLAVLIPEDEVTDNYLSYVLTDTLTEEQAKTLAINLADALTDNRYQKSANTVEITTKHTEIRDKVFNESYVYMCESLVRGRQNKETKQLVHQLTARAKHFNDRYKTALYRMRANPESFGDEDAIIIHELLVYSTIEMMRALHTNKTLYVSRQDMEAVQSITVAQMNPAIFQQLLGSFGAEGALNNRTYSACGLSISLGSNKQDQGPQSAYGGVDGKETNDTATQDEVCEYKGTFCYCCPYDTDGTPLSAPVEVTARRGKDGVAQCLRQGCGATLDKNGKGSKGRIYEKAMKLARLTKIGKTAAMA